MATAKGGVAAIGRDERATSAIEFGLFAPLLAIMIIGIVDLSMGYSRKLHLEQAANRSLERVQANERVDTDYQYLKAEAATAAGVAESDVTVDNWRECNRVRQTEFAGTCGSNAETSRYVQVTISSSYTPTFSYPALTTDSAGRIPITAAAALRVQ